MYLFFLPIVVYIFNMLLGTYTQYLNYRLIQKDKLSVWLLSLKYIP